MTITFIILFGLLGFLEIKFKPRLYTTSDYYIIWYGQYGRRNFIKFNRFIGK
jgi:hypothetical protein